MMEKETRFIMQWHNVCGNFLNDWSLAEVETRTVSSLIREKGAVAAVVQSASSAALL